TVVSKGSILYTTSTEYDSQGRTKSSTDTYGNITTYEYDNQDRQVVVKQANGLVTETVYNSKGQVWKSIVKAGSDIRTTEYKYDMFGNIIETIQPDGTTIKAEYNDKGQKISETNQLGQTRYFEYDYIGQLIKVTLPEVNGQSPVYEYSYDSQGNQLTIKDPNGNVTKFTYDENGNQLTRTLPDESTEYFEYNIKGQLIRQISFECVEITYKYDSYNHIETKTFTQNGIVEIWTYTYDMFGRVSEISQNGRITKTTYDLQGQTILIETPEGTIAYTYDKYGNQATVQTDNDNPVYYTYDRYGRLASVSSDNKTTYYEYDVFGNLSKTKLPNSVTTTYEYDNMNRLIKLSNFDDKNNNDIFDNGEGISEFSYTLDNLGRKDYAFEKFWTEYGEQENEIDWEYDEAGRLLYEKFDHYNDEFDQTSEWLYDLVGNRLKQTVNGTITTYNYDVNDRLLNEITNNKTTIYGYKQTQQTSKKVSENGILISETTFEYDVQGRMSVVTITSGNRTEITKYQYGTDGIRVFAEHEVWESDELKSKTKTEYLNDPLNITGYSQVLKQTETDVITNEETVTTYVIGHQRISQIVVKNGTEQEYYFTFDGHGSTRVLLDITAAILQLYSFDAYGNALDFDSAAALTEFLYSGEQFDSKIGQQYLRQRYYNPATGRFNRLDPFFGNLNDPRSLHKYLYTHADPTNGIDPNGELAIFPILAIIGIVLFAFPRTAHAPGNAIEGTGNSLSLDEKEVLGMCGANQVTKSELLILFEKIRNTPFPPYLSNNKCHDWMESFLRNYPQYDGSNMKKIELANGAIVLEPLTVPARPEALDYSVLNNDTNNIVLTYHSIGGMWSRRYWSYRGFSDHAIVRVTFPMTGHNPNVMYFDIGISDMGAFGGYGHWWNQYDNEFLLLLDMDKADPWVSSK
ncbi:MAG: hypothetical protein LBE12_20355, partial [Planctomycetaceae bacterium]|nr:hypothetical protein [Planctomycetaceae bacterium]